MASDVLRTGCVGVVFALLVSGLVGCAHMLPGITVGDRDEGVALSPVDKPSSAARAAGRPSSSDRSSSAAASTDRPSAVGAAAELPSLPRPTVRTLAVVRVLALPSAADEPTTLDPASADEQSVFADRLGDSAADVRVVWLPASRFASPPPLSRLRVAAAAEGADHLLLYQHRTPRRESGTLVYSVTFESCATARLYAVKSAAAVPIAEFEGRCTGTLGGLTPLQMTVHPHVEPATRRKAVAKLADSVAAILAER